MTRTLALKRTVLHELTGDELGAVNGAGSLSCLDYVSCHLLDCVRPAPSLEPRCLVVSGDLCA